MVKINIEGIIFDLDGTVYLGDETLPGAVETCGELRQRGIRLLFVSNKPLQGREVYSAKLTRLGIPAAPDEVITSTQVLGNYLKRTAPGLNYYVIGEENTRSELRSHGLIILDDRLEQDSRDVIDPAGIDAVIVAFDRTLDYRKLNIAYQALMRGAQFFATNADKTCPMPGGAIPDAGATIAALEHITGRKVQLVAGKPSPFMLQQASEFFGLPPDRCLMVGDRLETDILMGIEAGMHTALALTGATKRDQIAESPVQPEFVIENLSELLRII
jgi:NagD protein